MKRKKKALLLASIASLCLLCGCNNTEVVVIEGEQYVKNGEEYTRVDLTPKVFEPGQHVIHYTVRPSSFQGAEGWGTSTIEVPEVPEGYRYVNTITLDEAGYGHTSALVHVFVNEKRVEVVGTYNSKTNTIEYIEPGKIVEEKVLEMGD
ncbi:MAG: hypothetical protein IKR57_04360 [Bacilli bacterium]|nr:hypothetical protein [Bacilli bacterium]